MVYPSRKHSTPAASHTVEESRQFVKEAEAEIEKRDLIYHKVGHGGLKRASDIPLPDGIK